MKVNVHNDGKEKAHSFEAFTDVNNIHIYGYGSTQDEAIKNMKKEISLFAEDLMRLTYDEIIEIIKVDFKGDPI